MENTQLIKQLAEGDETAFRYLFDLYYDKLFHTAFYFLKSREVAEEAVSDVFYAIWKKRSTLPIVENMESYLFIAVKNQALHYLRRGSIPDFDSMDLYQIYLIQDTENPENTLLDKEYEQLIQKAVDSLPEKCKEVFRLFVAESLKHKEISALLDISIKTVEAHISRAYKRIAEYVNSKYEDKN